MKRFLPLLLGLMFCGPAFAQIPGGAVCGISPLPACNVAGSFSASLAVAPLTSTNLSSTISVTNTFQSIQALTAGRKGCLIQNNGTHNMLIFFGSIGSATSTNTFTLTPGQPVSCAVPGLAVVTDQISITGTAGDAYAASFQ